MKIIILAASRGEQLGKLTENIPKCLLGFGKETILERQIRILNELGITTSDIYVVAGYKSLEVRKIKGISLIINDEYMVTDNSYSLWLALKDNQDDILVLDGDLVYNLDTLKPIFRMTGNAILVTDSIQYNGNTGILAGERERLIKIGKHISSKRSYAGVMKLTAECARILFEELKDKKTSWYTVALNAILKEQNIKVCGVNDKIIGINTYSDYLKAKSYFGIEKETIWVVGASGFLGQKIYHILKRNYDVIGTRGKSAIEGLRELDLLNREAVRAYAKLIKPSIIINAAGISEPEACDENREKAYKINVEIVKNLVEICNEMKAKLIHISTDYVFDGKLYDLYEKNTERIPQNYYGITKVQAEDEVRKYGNNLILRVPLLYGYNNKSDKVTFPIKVLQKLERREEIFLDNKQIRYPVLIDDVALALSGSLHKKGIIHVTSDEPVTKYAWAKIIASEFGYDDCFIKEDMNSSLTNRPLHVKLSTNDQDYCVTNVRRGTQILRKQMACVFQLIYKNSPVETICGVNIGKYRYQLGKKLISVLPKKLIQETDYVIPVPNSGLYYAMGLAEQIQVPYLQALVKPDTFTRSFQISDIALREQVIREKIMPICEMLEDKNIILVDEAIFTGITLRVVCDIIKACGAKNIYIALPTPICRNICKQYVQPERRLLSQDIDEEDIAKYFKVNAVFFQKYCVFEESLRDLGNICKDCFINKESTI